MKKVFLIGIIVVFIGFLYLSDNTSTSTYEFFEYGKNQQASTEQVVPEDWLESNENFEELSLSQDLVLVKYGPREYFPENTTGECGACLKEKIDIFLIDHKMKVIANLLNMKSVENLCETDHEYVVNNDWKKVTHYTGDYKNVFSGGDIQWDSESFCLDIDNWGYSLCGTGEEPPENYKFSNVEDGWCGEALLGL